MPIYLDHNATTPLDARVLDAMLPWLQGAQGNPASVHGYGRATHAALETARAQVAGLVNAEASQVIFTSGGTEADNLALKGVCSGTPDRRVLVSAIEHAAVQAPADALAAQGWQVERIAVDAQGQLDLGDLDHLLARPARLVSVMLANNETGVIQDIAQIAARTHAHDALLHSDAIQAAGKIPLDFGPLNVDLMTLSAHKLNGPRGVGALIVNKSLHIMPLIHGGGQEHGLRGGTENLVGIVGFGKAAELARVELTARAAHLRTLRDAFESGLHEIEDTRIFAQHAERLSNTVQIGVAGFDGEAMVMELDRRGIAVSSGSACHSGSGKPSHVLSAMGMDEAAARSAVRISFGAGNSLADVEALLAALRQILKSRQEYARAVAW